MVPIKFFMDSKFLLLTLTILVVSGCATRSPYADLKTQYSKGMAKLDKRYLSGEINLSQYKTEVTALQKELLADVDQPQEIGPATQEILDAISQTLRTDAPLALQRRIPLEKIMARAQELDAALETRNLELIAIAWDRNKPGTAKRFFRALGRTQVSFGQGNQPTSHYSPSPLPSLNEGSLLNQGSPFSHYTFSSPGGFTNVSCAKLGNSEHCTVS